MDPRFHIAHQQQKKRRPRKAANKRSWPQLCLAEKPEHVSHTTSAPTLPNPKHDDSESEHLNPTKPASPLDTDKPVAQKISPSQAIGYTYEKKAIAYLQAQGLILLAHNLSCPLGEIDAVMRDGSILVFVEIRHRHRQEYGGASASITAHKLLRLRRTAAYFLPQLSSAFFHGKTPFCRFDAMVSQAQGTEWVWLKHITQ
ncbi:MAG: YraN family protein [Pelistega sp.]|nr:YraN family protein [Pelistega sp.]